MAEYKNFINGKFVPAKSGKTYENRNPADTDDLIGTFPSSEAADVSDAVAAAKAAYPKWRAMPAPARGEIMRKALGKLRRLVAPADVDNLGML